MIPVLNKPSNSSPLDSDFALMFAENAECMVCMDTEGRICEFNTNAERAFGYKREEVIGKELAEILIPHELREAHRRGLAYFLKTGTAVVIGKCIDVPALCADGTTVPVELEISKAIVNGSLCFIGCLRMQSASVIGES